MINETSKIISLSVPVMEHGEGPVWDERNQLIHWVDLLKGEWHQYDPATRSHHQQDCGEAVGVVSLRENGGFLYGLRSGFGISDAITSEVSVFEKIDDNEPNVRFNDGATAPCGRFYAGTMQDDGAAPVGKLYRVDHDLKVTVMDENLYVPNGMGWSLDGRTFYMIDTGQHCIFAYDYDEKTGDLSDRRVFKQFLDDVNPDGMCIDAEGNFWIAIWGGSRIEVLDKYGVFEKKIDLPFTHPTSCCFGGANLEDLYITTSQLVLTPNQKEDQPLAGETLVIYQAGKGRLEPRFYG